MNLKLAVNSCYCLLSREIEPSLSTAAVTEASCGVGDLTLKTTDSGIGSIAQRPTRRTDSSGRRRLVDSQVLSVTSSADDDDDDHTRMSAGESTGLTDVDVALTWHLSRCSAVLQVFAMMMIKCSACIVKLTGRQINRPHVKRKQQEAKLSLG